MTLTLTIDNSWLGRPDVLARILLHVRTLESVAPMPAVRTPGDDDGDGDELAALLAGMDEPPAALPVRPSAPPAVKPSAPAPTMTVPTTGQGLYKWLIANRALPRATALGKARGYPRMLTEYSPDQVAAAYAELTGPPAAAAPAVNGNGNGRHRH
jgi:hypothetical protein